MSDSPIFDELQQRPPVSASAAQQRHVTPLVARLAAERGVTLATIKGTGAGGRITKGDVLAAAPAVPADLDEANYRALFGEDGSRSVRTAAAASARAASSQSAAAAALVSNALQEHETRMQARQRLQSGPDFTSIEEWAAIQDAAHGGPPTLSPGTTDPEAQ